MQRSKSFGMDWKNWKTSTARIQLLTIWMAMNPESDILPALNGGPPSRGTE